MSSAGENMDSPSKTLTEGIILLLLSAVSYAGAYLYEFGYAGHFGIPKEYVFVDARGLVVFFVGFVSILIFTYQVVNFIQIAREGDSKKPLALLLKKQCVWFGVPTVFALIAAAPFREWFNIFLLPLIVLAGDLIAPFLLRKVKGGFLAALDECLKEGGSTVPMPIDKKLALASGKEILGLVYLIVMLLFIANAMGAGEARRKTEFLFTSDGSKVLLRRYGTDWLFAEYDTATHTIRPKFTVIDFAKEKTELKLMKRGAAEKVVAETELKSVVAMPLKPPVQTNGSNVVELPR